MSNREDLITLEKAFLTYASYGSIRTYDSVYPYFLKELNCIAIRDSLIEGGYLKLATIDESIPYYPYDELRKILKEHGCPIGNSKEKVVKNVRDNIKQNFLLEYFGYCCYIPTEFGKRYVTQGIDYYSADLQLALLKIRDIDKYEKYTDIEEYQKALQIEKKQSLSEGFIKKIPERIYSKFARYKKPLFMVYDDDNVDSSKNREKILYIKEQINQNINMYDEDGSIKYFFSVENSIEDIVVNMVLAKEVKIVKLAKFDENDFSENYVAIIPQTHSLYEDLLLWMLVTEKISVPTIYGIPLYYFCVGIDISYKYRNYSQVKKILYNEVADTPYEIMKYFNQSYPVHTLLELNYYYFYRKAYSTVNEMKMEAEYKKIIISLMENNLIPAMWKSEFSLYILVSLYFEDAIFQYRTSWLGGQSLDIYIPQHKIAIEYQGIQHYKAVDYFGGEETYRETKRRDFEKRQKCERNNVKLLYWSYQTEISDLNLMELFEDLNIRLHKKKETKYKHLENNEKTKKHGITKEKQIIACFDLAGKYVKKYNTINEAAADIGVSTTSISKVLRGERNSAGSYIWKKYVETEEIPPIINVYFDTSLTNAGKSYAVEQYTVDGKFVRKFDTVMNAEQITNISRDSIKDAVNGKSKTAGGYIWKRVNM